MKTENTCRLGNAFPFVSFSSTGGGLSNLYDRYTKHHVVDYVRFQTGPKWFQRIIFNVSDFFIFIGAVLAVIGSEA